MKNKIWILMAIAAMVLMSCDTDQKQGPQPIYCPDTDNDGNGHLGIGEDCIKDTGECTGYHNYAKGTTFPKPIYRVGAEFAALPTAVSTIIETFANTITDPDDQAKFLATVSKEIRVAESGDKGQSGGIWTVLASGPIANDMKVIAHPTSNHLGIDESACLGSDRAGDAKCGLQDHRNAAQKLAFPDDGVGRPIYRYGKLSNYNISDPKEIEKTVDMIIDIFTGTGGLLSRGEFTYNAINDNIDKLCVTKSEDGTWTWGGDGTVLGVDPAASASQLKNRFARIEPGNPTNLDIKEPVAGLAQLQQALNRVIFMAGNEKAKQVIAGGADKDPKVNTVAQNFRLNRQAIARNNRNVKSLLRQA